MLMRWVGYDKSDLATTPALRSASSITYLPGVLGATLSRRCWRFSSQTDQNVAHLGASLCQRERIELKYIPVLTNYLSFLSSCCLSLLHS